MCEGEESRLPAGATELVLTDAPFSSRAFRPSAVFNHLASRTHAAPQHSAAGPGAFDPPESFINRIISISIDIVMSIS